MKTLATNKTNELIERIKTLAPPELYSDEANADLQVCDELSHVMSSKSKRTHKRRRKKLQGRIRHHNGNKLLRELSSQQISNYQDSLIDQHQARVEEVRERSKAREANLQRRREASLGVAANFMRSVRNGQSLSRYQYARGVTAFFWIDEESPDDYATRMIYEAHQRRWEEDADEIEAINGRPGEGIVEFGEDDRDADRRSHVSYWWKSAWQHPDEWLVEQYVDAHGLANHDKVATALAHVQQEYMQDIPYDLLSVRRMLCVFPDESDWVEKTWDQIRKLAGTRLRETGIRTRWTKVENLVESFTTPPQPRIAYVTGDTYLIKENLKESGWRWTPDCKAWRLEVAEAISASDVQEAILHDCNLPSDYSISVTINQK